MVRTEIQLFLKNAPGELGKLSTMLAESKINIDAMTIQDASAYVQELFKARGKSLKRVAPAASYGSMKKDSADFALIRLLVDQTDKAIDLFLRGSMFSISCRSLRWKLIISRAPWRQWPKNSGRKASISITFTGLPCPGSQNPFLYSALRTSTLLPSFSKNNQNELIADGSLLIVETRKYLISS